jgi:hypothetical protein
MSKLEANSCHFLLAQESRRKFSSIDIPSIHGTVGRTPLSGEVSAKMGIIFRF